MMATKSSLMAGLGKQRRLPGAILTALALKVVLCTAPVFAEPARAQSAAPVAEAAQDTAAPVASPGATQELTPDGGPQPIVPVAPPTGEIKPQPNLADTSLPSSLPRDLSPWGMFVSAVPIVQAVMLALAFASLVTWTVWLAKTIELWNARKLARRGIEVLASAPSLRAAEKQLAKSPSPIARFAAAAAGEADRSDGLAAEGVKDRAAILLSRIEAQTGRTIARGTGTLATIGATAVF
ncbi:MAG: tonB-system energizer ExbB, partial [Beijerinckiaceae bacterium]|nr:tonB-system energizer ExbB [Beijerinckiaceae bacterium]